MKRRAVSQAAPAEASEGLGRGMESKLLSRRDLAFVLYELLDTAALTARERYADHARETFDAALDLAERIARDHFAPHNRAADLHEPEFDGERVTLIPEVAAALKVFVDAGLMASEHDYDFGGMQLPLTVAKACFALFNAANVGTSSYPFLTIGNANLLLGRPTEALAAFEKASALRSDFWEAVNNQGLVLFELNRPKEAIERWRRVLKIKPTAAETSLALGSALFESNPQNRSEALQLAENALNEDPNYVRDAYQKEQLWGVKLRSATGRLLALPELKPMVERASANATGHDKDDDESP